MRNKFAKESFEQSTQKTIYTYWISFRLSTATEELKVSYSDRYKTLKSIIDGTFWNENTEAEEPIHESTSFYIFESFEDVQSIKFEIGEALDKNYDFVIIKCLETGLIEFCGTYNSPKLANLKNNL